MPTYKALIIGINYIDTSYELAGCINDASAVYKHLLENYPITKNDIKILTDKTNLLPTKDNIKAAIKWLVHDADKKSRLFFHYSGHGKQKYDKEGEEIDGKDECILALDGKIRDDKIQKWLIDTIPTGAVLTTVFDCCYSGTFLDLTQEEPRETTSCCKSKKQKSKYNSKNVIYIGGCRDDQYSYEMREESKNRGILSYYLYRILDKIPTITYNELIIELENKIRVHKSKKQIPIIDCTKNIDMDNIVKLI